MIIVTGSNGFIGSNLIRQLNIENETDIIAVDDHSNSDLRSNIKDCKILKTTSIDNFLSDVLSGEYDDKNIEAIFHQGACSDTMEWDYEFLLKNNFEVYSIGDIGDLTYPYKILPNDH